MSTLQNRNKTARITPEKLISAVSGKNNFHVPARHPSNHHRGESGVVGEGFAARTDNVIEHLQGQFGHRMLDDMIHSNLFSIGLSLARFIQLIAAGTYGKTPH